jgi:formiminoglutamase
VSVEIEVRRGEAPLLLGLPHTGTFLPDDVAANLNELGHARADTDWHIHEVYAGLVEDVTTVRTPVHRYAIDVNRDPSGQSLYPGQNTTGLCPLTDFEGHSIYREGAAPDAAETERLRLAFHAPYHAALEAEMGRLVDQHGFAILYDCHSIRSHIPFLFEGRLPDFNIGTNNGQTCDPGIEALVHQHCEGASGFSSVLNGRFKGGWTTRHYGRPHLGWHAIQMELAQSTYMTEAAPWDIFPDRMDRLRAELGKILRALLDWRPT